MAVGGWTPLSSAKVPCKRATVFRISGQFEMVTGAIYISNNFGEATSGDKFFET